MSMLSPLRSSLRLPGIMHLEQRNPSNEHDHESRTLFRALFIIMAKRSFLFLMGTRVRHEVQKKLMAKAVDVKACVTQIAFFVAKTAYGTCQTWERRIAMQDREAVSSTVLLIRRVLTLLKRVR